MDTEAIISMSATGISQEANEKFYFNLNTDDWVRHFSEFINIGSGNWKLDSYITIKELEPTSVGEAGTYLGSGAMFTVEFSDSDKYKDLINFETVLVEV